MNATFKSLLKKQDLFTMSQKWPLEAKLQAILNKEFTTIDDAIVLSAFKSNIKRVSYTDLTGKEMFTNKFHIDMFLTKKPTTEYVLQQGISFAFALKDKLQKYSPDKFKIIVSAEKGEHGFFCTVGFHKIRLNESWLGADLEEYKENGLLVIDTYP